LEDAPGALVALKFEVALRSNRVHDRTSVLLALMTDVPVHDFFRPAKSSVARIVHDRYRALRRISRVAESKTLTEIAGNLHRSGAGDAIELSVLLPSQLTTRLSSSQMRR